MPGRKSPPPHLLVDDMALQALLVEDPGGPLAGRLLTEGQLKLRVRHQSQLEIYHGRLSVIRIRFADQAPNFKNRVRIRRYYLL